MTEPVKLVTCPICHRGGRRVTKAGTIWRHQPFGMNYAGHMVPACKGSGMAAFKQRAEPKPGASPP